MVLIMMRLSKKERQKKLRQTIEENPFVTDEELSEKFSVVFKRLGLIEWNWLFQNLGNE